MQPTDYDVSVLITEEGFGHRGIAIWRSLCRPTRSCAAVKERGFITAFFIAHEIAHALGVNHDGHGNDCHGSKYDSAIMTPKYVSKLNHFWWSDCSSTKMKAVIKDLPCLNNEYKSINNNYPLKSDGKLDTYIGKPWSYDFQCRMEFGDNFKLCLRTQFNAQNYGARMLQAKNMFATPIKLHLCQEHLVGVIKPEFGGTPCEGETSEWDTCLNTKCENYEDGKQKDCDKWDHMQIRNGTHKWQAFEGQNDEVVTLDVLVENGTPCGYTKNISNICMNGKCITVGCDGKINSTLIEDQCGVCGGNGSQCKVISGHFLQKPRSGKHTMLHICYDKDNGQRVDDDKCLLLKAPRRDEVPCQRRLQCSAVPNHRFQWASSNWSKCYCESGSSKGFQWREIWCEQVKVSDNKEAIEKADLTKCQDVTNKPEENMTCPLTSCIPQLRWKTGSDFGPCNAKCGETGEEKTIILCEFESKNGTVDMVDISRCEQIIKPTPTSRSCTADPCEIEPKLFTWMPLDDWSDCDAACNQNGTHLRLYVCQEIITHNHHINVSSSLCDINTRPDERKECQGLPCTLKWQLGEWSECSVTCGKGKHYRKVFCGDPISDHDDNRCLETPPPMSKICNMKECPEQSDEDCVNKHSYCYVYKDLYTSNRWDYLTTLVTDDLTTLVTDDLTTLVTDDLTTLVTDDLTTLVTDDLTTLVTDDLTTLVTDDLTTLVTDGII
ncbi:hypothetical protein Btru_008195 [Bulinus truncatus]|nr:hypothetical protein Btru_008195 [Bulinus truncatus]